MPDPSAGLGRSVSSDSSDIPPQQLPLEPQQPPLWPLADRLLVRRTQIETMKGQPGKAMIIFGSGSIVSQLTPHGLIDEYQFVVCPIFAGSGQPLLSGVSKHLRLDLLEAEPLPSGDVMLRYARPDSIGGEGGRRTRRCTYGSND